MVFKSILVIIGTVIGLSAGEGIVRLIAPRVLVKPCLQNDPDLGFTGVPNCDYLDDWQKTFFTYPVHLNNLGLRMESDLLATDSNLVLCLGDSYLYGWGQSLENSFFGLMENELKKRASKWKLINAGFPAYSTGHISKMLKKLSAGHEIKKAIYFMYCNDVFDNVNPNINYRTHLFREDAQGEIKLKAVKVYSNWKRNLHKIKLISWLYRNSHLFILAKETLEGKRKSIVPGRIFYDTTLTDERIDLMDRVSIAHIENLYRICKNKGIDLMVVWIPNWLELDLKNTENWHTNFPFETFKCRLQTKMSTQDWKFTFFDPTENINHSLSGKKVDIDDYYFGEGHYNEKGHRLFYESTKNEFQLFLQR